MSADIEGSKGEVGAAKGRLTPLTANRGVFMSLSLDWLTFSKSKCIKDLRDIQDEIIRTFKSFREYRRLKHGYEGVDLAVDGVLTTRGSHVVADFPGQAMQYVRYSLGMSDEKVIEWFLSRGFKARRLDGAIDTADKSLNPLVAIRYHQNENVRCEASKWYYQPPGLTAGKAIFPKRGKGMTVYAGSPKSERRLRIYDKLEEMLLKTGEIPMNEFGEPLEHLTRIELQCRREAAQLLACQILQRGIGVIRPVMAGYLSFLNPRDKRKKRRREVARWWERIVGEERTCLTLPQVVMSPDRSLKWIKKQVLPTLKAMREIAPDKWKALVEDWMPEYELPPATAREWNAWVTARAAYKAATEELIRQEKEDNEEWRVQKLLADASPTEYDEEAC